jgi:ureidoglycolate lyase
MRLLRFSTANEPEIGALIDDSGIVPLNRALPDMPKDMCLIIDHWADWRDRIELAVSHASDVLDLASTRIVQPIERPGKMMAIGLNYADHIEESGLAKPDKQLWFAKMGTSANGPFDPVQIPRVSDYVDYEVELVAVIGKRCKHVTVDAAKDVVFGYCVGNDVTERMWQHATPQWTLGKSFDTHAPFGPWITTADMIADPHDLDIKCWIDGELRQTSNTQHLVFNLWDQIAHLSAAMTLEPGDLIFTGTPGGIGAAMDPRQFLKAGQVMRCEIDQLGVIENRCVAEE